MGHFILHTTSSLKKKKDPYKLTAQKIYGCEVNYFKVKPQQKTKMLIKAKLHYKLQSLLRELGSRQMLGWGLVGQGAIDTPGRRQDWSWTLKEEDCSFLG